MPKESKENLRDKLDGNELDLSLSNLTTVPVKELAALPKATHLDLSCNQITALPDAFCTLTHLVKIDLSKNALTQLPTSIGSLQRLQYLDLYSNQLTSLPVGICYLKNLKWLDLKDNPLNEHLKSVAGDCLDDVQCKRCALQVVAFMKQVQSEQERQKQKRLQQERELEAAKKANEEKERERKKAEKKAEKERKRKAYEEANKAKRHVEETLESQPDDSDQVKTANGVKTVTPKKEQTGLSCCGAFMAALLGLVAIMIGLYFYCDHNKADTMCQTSREHVLKYYHQARIALESFTVGKQ